MVKSAPIETYSIVKSAPDDTNSHSPQYLGPELTLSTCRSAPIKTTSTVKSAPIETTCTRPYKGMVLPPTVMEHEDWEEEEDAEVGAGGYTSGSFQYA